MLDSFRPGLAARSDAPELLNAPGVDETIRGNTLKQFALLNLLFSRFRRLLKKYILADMLKNPDRAHSLLDIGAGACDIPLWLAKECRRRGLCIDITCLDSDEKVVAYARRACAPFANMTVIHKNALAIDTLPKFDYVFSNHFLHHLETDEVPEMIRLIRRRADRLFLLIDLSRSAFSYLGFTIFAGLFLRRSFHFHDGRLSIKRAFRRDEMETLVNRSGAAEDIRVGKMWPARIFVTGGPALKN